MSDEKKRNQLATRIRRGPRNSPRSNSRERQAACLRMLIYYTLTIRAGFRISVRRRALWTPKRVTSIPVAESADHPADKQATKEDSGHPAAVPPYTRSAGLVRDLRLFVEPFISEREAFALSRTWTVEDDSVNGCSGPTTGRRSLTSPALIWCDLSSLRARLLSRGASTPRWPTNEDMKKQPVEESVYDDGSI